VGQTLEKSDEQIKNNKIKKSKEQQPQDLYNILQDLPIDKTEIVSNNLLGETPMEKSTIFKKSTSIESLSIDDSINQKQSKLLNNNAVQTNAEAQSFGNQLNVKKSYKNSQKMEKSNKNSGYMINNDKSFEKFFKDPNTKQSYSKDSNQFNSKNSRENYDLYKQYNNNSNNNSNSKMQTMVDNNQSQSTPYFQKSINKDKYYNSSRIGYMNYYTQDSKK
jgi:hypothetical protein